MGILLARMYVYPHACWLPTQVRQGVGSPGDWSYRKVITMASLDGNYAEVQEEAT